MDESGPGGQFGAEGAREKELAFLANDGTSRQMALYVTKNIFVKPQMQVAFVPHEESQSTAENVSGSQAGLAVVLSREPAVEQRTGANGKDG